MVSGKKGTLFFDLDGTLANTSEDISDALNATLNEFGLPSIPHEVVMSYVGDGVRPLIKKTLKKIGREEEEEKILKAFLKRYEEWIARKTRLYDGVLDIIFFLKSEGINIILLTNKIEYLTIHLLRELEILHVFDGIVGGDTFPYKKPEKELLDCIKERFAVSPPFFILGDGKNDFLFAKNTGITFIFAKWGFSSEEEVFSDNEKNTVKIYQIKENRDDENERKEGAENTQRHDKSIEVFIIKKPYDIYTIFKNKL